MSRAASAQRGIVRDLGLLIGVPLAFAVLVIVGMTLWWQPWTSYVVPAGTDASDIVAGTWDWTTAPADSFCIANRHTIRFSDDRRVMSIAQLHAWTEDDGSTRRVSIYDLREGSRGHLRGRIRGESRLTPMGEPVVWDLRLTSSDSYQWERTDWPAFAATAEIHRCPPGTPEAPDEAGEN